MSPVVGDPLTAPRLLPLIGDDESFAALLNSLGCDIGLLDSRGRLRWHSAQWIDRLHTLGLTSPMTGQVLETTRLPDGASPALRPGESTAYEFANIVNRVLIGGQTQTEGELTAVAQGHWDEPSAAAAGLGEATPHEMSRAPGKSSNVIDLRTRRPLHSELPGTCVNVTVTRVTPRLISIALRDITRLRSHEESLHYLAYHDTLTGLPNRNSIQHRIEDALHRAVRRSTGVGVLFCDLDNFKQVNDSQGHQAGDGLLREIAQRWSGWVRETDVLARMSGDEFLLLADAVAGPAELAGLAHRLNAGLAPAFRVDGRTVRISMCIGGVYISGHDAHAMTSESLVAAADAALYAAKRRGDDQLVIKDLSIPPGPAPVPPDVA